MRRSVGPLILLAVWMLMVASCAAPERVNDRMAFFGTLFTGAEQSGNFGRIPEILQTTRLAPSTDPYVFPLGKQIRLPDSFFFKGSVDTAQYLDETDTAALLVIKNGELRHEGYYLTGGPEVTWLSMSVAKSFVSALVGIAIEEGAISSVEDPITSYLVGFEGSAYDGVRIKDILQMSSGARWNEDYSDPASDVARLGGTLVTGGSLNAFSRTLERARPPGTFNLYNSTDTQVLGELLVTVTGRTITDYMQEKLWEPLGMASAGYWIIDDSGMEMAFGGLNATARDYAKIGELFLRGGQWRGRQLVPASWVADSVTPDAPHLLPGDNPNSDFVLGYGYQWWIMDGDEGEYSAIGVYNQFIYVNPAHGLVIVKLSANNSYGLTLDESSYREVETIAFFRAIRDRLAIDSEVP